MRCQSEDSKTSNCISKQVVKTSGAKEIHFTKSLLGRTNCNPQNLINMNEAETRAELIDPKLKECGWDSKANPHVKVHREFIIAPGKIKASGGRGKAVIADYVLAYKNRK